MGYTQEELMYCRGASVPDLIGETCKLLFVGINPGLQTAMTGIHFAHPSNRFWPALREAGMIDRVPELSPPTPSVPLLRNEGRHRSQLSAAATHTHFAHPGNRLYPALELAGLVELTIDRTAGFNDADRQSIVDRGIGITNLVNRATVRASELDRGELRAGAARLEQFVAEHKPRVVAIAGVTAYRAAFRQPRAVNGRQDTELASSELWVVPNPSGLNAHETTASLAEWYGRVARRAGII